MHPLERPNVYLREARPRDIPRLIEVAASNAFATTNFQPHVDDLMRKITHSQDSFRGKPPWERREFFFATLNRPDGAVVGSATLVAKHGRVDEPHTAWQMVRNTKVASGKVVDDSYLIFVVEHDGPAEVGANVVDRAQQGRGYGKAGSWVRFLWAAMPRQRDWFQGRMCLSEFLPEYVTAADGNRTTPFYEALAKRFLGGRHYDEMDRATMLNRKLLTGRFRRRVQVADLPEEARRGIGQIGTGSLPARALLSPLGFRFSGQVDPIDAGPHYLGPFDENPIFIGAKTLFYDGTAGHQPRTEWSRRDWRYGLIGVQRDGSEPTFEAVAAPFYIRKGRLRTVAESAQALRLEPGESVTAFAYPVSDASVIRSPAHL